jgi:hypothetical protein
MTYNIKPLSKHFPYEGETVHHLFLEKVDGTLLSDIKIYIESDINDIAQFIRDCEYPLGFNEWFNNTKNVSFKDLEELFLTNCLKVYSLNIHNYTYAQARIDLYGYTDRIKIKFNKNIHIKIAMIDEFDERLTDKDGVALLCDVYLLYTIDGEIDTVNIDKDKLRQEIYDLVD